MRRCPCPESGLPRVKMAVKMDEVQQKLLERRKQVLDFFSRNFDPYKAIYAQHLQPPYPNVKVFNSVQEYAAAIKKGVSGKEESQPGMSNSSLFTMETGGTTPGKVIKNKDKFHTRTVQNFSRVLKKNQHPDDSEEYTCKKQEDKHVTEERTPLADSPVINKNITRSSIESRLKSISEQSLCNISSAISEGSGMIDESFRQELKRPLHRPKGRTRKNVVHRMEDAQQGPFKVLYQSLREQCRLKVWIRKYKGFRSVCTGFLIAFDKHMNLAMIDVDEIYTVEEDQLKKCGVNNVKRMEKDKLSNKHDMEQKEILVKGIPDSKSEPKSLAVRDGVPPCDTAHKCDKEKNTFKKETSISGSNVLSSDFPLSDDKVSSTRNSLLHDDNESSSNFYQTIDAYVEKKSGTLPPDNHECLTVISSELYKSYNFDLQRENSNPTGCDRNTLFTFKTTSEMKNPLNEENSSDRIMVNKLKDIGPSCNNERKENTLSSAVVSKKDTCCKSHSIKIITELSKDNETASINEKCLEKKGNSNSSLTPKESLHSYGLEDTLSDMTYTPKYPKYPSSLSKLLLHSNVHLLETTDNLSKPTADAPDSKSYSPKSKLFPQCSSETRNSIEDPSVCNLSSGTSSTANLGDSTTDSNAVKDPCNSSPSEKIYPSNSRTCLNHSTRSPSHFPVDQCHLTSGPERSNTDPAISVRNTLKSSANLSVRTEEMSTICALNHENVDEKVTSRASSRESDGDHGTVFSEKDLHIALTEDLSKEHSGDLLNSIEPIENVTNESQVENVSLRNPMPTELDHRTEIQDSTSKNNCEGNFSEIISNAINYFQISSSTVHDRKGKAAGRLHCLYSIATNIYTNLTQYQAVPSITSKSKNVYTACDRLDASGVVSEVIRQKAPEPQDVCVTAENTDKHTRKLSGDLSIPENTLSSKDDNCEGSSSLTLQSRTHIMSCATLEDKDSKTNAPEISQSPEVKDKTISTGRVEYVSDGDGLAVIRGKHLSTRCSDQPSRTMHLACQVTKDLTEDVIPNIITGVVSDQKSNSLSQDVNAALIVVNEMYQNNGVVHSSQSSSRKCDVSKDVECPVKEEMRIISNYEQHKDDNLSESLSLSVPVPCEAKSGELNSDLEEGEILSDSDPKEVNEVASDLSKAELNSDLKEVQVLSTTGGKQKQASCQVVLHNKKVLEKSVVSKSKAGSRGSTSSKKEFRSDRKIERSVSVKSHSESMLGEVETEKSRKSMSSSLVNVERAKVSLHKSGMKIESTHGKDDVRKCTREGKKSIHTKSFQDAREIIRRRRERYARERLADARYSAQNSSSDDSETDTRAHRTRPKLRDQRCTKYDRHDKFTDLKSTREIRRGRSVEESDEATQTKQARVSSTHHTGSKTLTCKSTLQTRVREKVELRSMYEIGRKGSCSRQATVTCKGVTDSYRSSAAICDSKSSRVIERSDKRVDSVGSMNEKKGCDGNKKSSTKEELSKEYKPLPKDISGNRERKTSQKETDGRVKVIDSKNEKGTRKGLIVTEKRGIKETVIEKMNMRDKGLSTEPKISERESTKQRSSKDRKTKISVSSKTSSGNRCTQMKQVEKILKEKEMDAGPSKTEELRETKTDSWSKNSTSKSTHGGEASLVSSAGKDIRKKCNTSRSGNSELETKRQFVEERSPVPSSKTETVGKNTASHTKSTSGHSKRVLDVSSSHVREKRTVSSKDSKTREEKSSIRTRSTKRRYERSERGTCLRFRDSRDSSSKGGESLAGVMARTRNNLETKEDSKTLSNSKEMERHISKIDKLKHIDPVKTRKESGTRHPSKVSTVKNKNTPLKSNQVKPPTKRNSKTMEPDKVSVSKKRPFSPSNQELRSLKPRLEIVRLQCKEVVNKEKLSIALEGELCRNESVRPALERLGETLALAQYCGRGKMLVLKRRHVNQLFIRGDNVIMVACNAT